MANGATSLNLTRPSSRLGTSGAGLQVLPSNGATPTPVQAAQQIASPGLEVIASPNNPLARVATIPAGTEAISPGPAATVTLPSGQAGNVMGASDANLTVPVGGATTGGGGGGGNAGGLAAQRQALINKNLAGLEELINQQFMDTIADLDLGETAVKAEAGRGRSEVEARRAAGIEQARAGGRAARASARQTRADQESETRRRIRAFGGGPSSGALELFNRLDTAFQGAISGINVSEAEAVNTAGTIADQALNAIETQLQNAINTIESERRGARRTKNEAIFQARQAAAEQALSVMEWLSGVASSGGSGGSLTSAQIQARQTEAQNQILTGVAQLIQGGADPTAVINANIPTALEVGGLDFANQVANLAGQFSTTGFEAPLTAEEQFLLNQRRQAAASGVDLTNL